MPLDDARIWTVELPSVRLQRLRSAVEGELDLALDYDGTPDGAYTLGGNQLAFDVDQGVALALSNFMLWTAPAAGVYVRALEAGLTPRAARAAEYLIPIIGAGTVSQSATILDNLGRRWSIVAAFTTGASPGLYEAPFSSSGTVAVSSAHRLQLRCETEGDLLYSGYGLPSSFTFSPAVSGVTLETAANGTYLVSGRDDESTSSLRQRVSEAGGRKNGSTPGLRAALLEVANVRAVSITRSPGTIRVGVGGVDGSFAQSDLFDIATILYEHVAAGVVTEGDESLVIEDVNGEDFTVFYDVIGMETVAVSAELILDGTVLAADAIATATAALEALGASLDRGDPIRVLHAQRALAVPGVDGLGFLKFNAVAATADLYPSTTATQFIVLPAVTVAP